MEKDRTIEIGVGVFVALGILALFLLAMRVSNLGNGGDDLGYAVAARFDNIGGLKVRAPVTMAGVRIGRVTDIEFDQSTYQALVTLGLSDRHRQLPSDTTASILTAGLLGEQYISLDAGGDDRYLKEGDEISLTQSALLLENLIGQFIFDKGDPGADTGMELFDPESTGGETEADIQPPPPEPVHEPMSRPEWPTMPAPFPR